MSEAPGRAAAAAQPSAGRLLREAREKQGLHIAALAAAIKVAPKKLESLEADRFDELPDATFTRALAQTVCRALKTDPGEVMRLLPPPSGHRLEQVGEGLNTPFRERPGALVQRDWVQTAASPVFWIVALILVATVGVYFLPARLTDRATGRSRPAAASAVTSVVEPGVPPPEAIEAAASTPLVPSPAMQAASAAPAVAADAAASAPVAAPVSAAPETPASAALGGAMPDPTAAAAAPPGMLQVSATAASWVEVSDARGRPLLSRLLQPGEAVGVDGVPPLKVRIGNAAGTQVVFRGQPTDLQAFTRDNVARLELK